MTPFVLPVLGQEPYKVLVASPGLLNDLAQSVPLLHLNNAYTGHGTGFVGGEAIDLDQETTRNGKL